MSVQSPTPTGAIGPESYGESRGGGGWVIFAGVMLLIVGTMNLIDGIAAVGNSQFFVHGAKYVFGDLNTWGWIVIVVGTAQLLTALGVLANSRGAAWLGILFASANAIVQLLFIPAAPFFAVSLFTLDLLVIYGLAVYGGRVGR